MSQTVKNSCSTEPFAFDWNAYLGGVGSIDTSTWTAPPGITIVSQEFAANITTVVLSGGTPGVTYAVKNTITISLTGVTDCRTLFVEVE